MVRRLEITENVAHQHRFDHSLEVVEVANYIFKDPNTVEKRLFDPPIEVFSLLLASLEVLTAETQKLIDILRPFHLLWLVVADGFKEVRKVVSGVEHGFNIVLLLCDKLYRIFLKLAHILLSDHHERNHGLIEDIVKVFLHFLQSLANSSCFSAIFNSIVESLGSHIVGLPLEQ
jgi:hypothetical protein